MIKFTEPQRILFESWACLLLTNAHKYESEKGMGDFVNNPFHVGAFTLLQGLYLLGYRTHEQVVIMFNELMDRVEVSIKDIGFEATAELYSVNKILNETLKI